MEGGFVAGSEGPRSNTKVEITKSHAEVPVVLVTETPVPDNMPGAAALRAAGIETVEEAQAMTLDQLDELKDIGHETATQIKGFVPDAAAKKAARDAAIEKAGKTAVKGGPAPAADDKAPVPVTPDTLIADTDMPGAGKLSGTKVKGKKLASVGDVPALTRDDLITIDGIGDSTADAIIAWLASHKK